MRIKQIFESVSAGGMGTGSFATAPSAEKKMIRRQPKENIDPADQGEYDQEGDMARDQLYTAAEAAAELRSILSSDENLPEWVQSKITKAMDYLDTARDYMKSKNVKEGFLGKGLKQGKYYLQSIYNDSHIFADPGDEQGRPLEFDTADEAYSFYNNMNGREIDEFAVHVFDQGQLKHVDEDGNVAEGFFGDVGSAAVRGFKEIGKEIGLVKEPKADYSQTPHNRPDGPRFSGGQRQVAPPPKSLQGGPRLSGGTPDEFRAMMAAKEKEKAAAIAKRRAQKEVSEGSGSNISTLDAVFNEHDFYRLEHIWPALEAGDKEEALRQINHYLRKGKNRAWWGDLQALDIKIDPSDVENSQVMWSKSPQQDMAVQENKKGVKAVKHTVKPRNFVAKNASATTSGAGPHKDKKKAAKQGEVKHKGKEPAYESRLWAALEKRIVR